MDIRQLRYFIAIAETGSFSRGADRLHVAQPALSQHVLAMEAALGVTLLQRNPRGVVLTEAGARLLARARDIDASFSGLADHVRGAVLPAGQVRFGMPATINEQIGVTLIETGRGQFPDIRIRIAEAMSGYVLDWLREGSVDLALLYNVPDQQGLKLHHAFTEEICLFGPPDQKGAPTAKTITLAAALQLPLIMPGPAHGLRDLIEAAAKSIGRSVTPEIEIDSYRQIKQLAARGLAFGMLPTTAIRREVADGIFKSWTIETPTLARRIFLGHQAGKPLSAASRAIGHLSWQILENFVRTGVWSAAWNDDQTAGQWPGVA